MWFFGGVGLAKDCCPEESWQSLRLPAEKPKIDSFNDLALMDFFG